jgi:hypothetical protein
MCKGHEMRNTQKQQELEEILIEEEYDPVTLKERSEDEHLLEETFDKYGQKKVAQMVKTAYGKVVNGYAIVREHLTPLAIIAMCVFLAVPILFLTFFIKNRWWQNGSMIFACAFFSCGSILAAYFIVYRGFIKNTKKLFDVYYFQQGKKRIIIYQNNKYTIYYRSRKEFICVENKTKKWVKDYERADCMNLKLGFNSLVGDLKYRKLKKGGFKIWTPARYDTSTQLHVFSGYASLTVDDENYPIKVFIAGGRYTSYIYSFKNDLEFKVMLPKEMLAICERLNIEPPNENQWLSFE